MIFLQRLLLSVTLISTNCIAEINTVTLSEQIIPIKRYFDGKVEAINSATVSGQTSGRVAEILFDIGDRVAQGETLIRLVSEDQQAGLQQAEASVSEAKASLSLEKKEFSRLKSLFDKKLVSRADMDRSEGKLKTITAQLEKTQGALRQAKQQLNYTTIQAPFAGVVSERHIELGESVSPGVPLMSGFDPDRLRVILDIPQDVYETVKAEPEIKILSAENKLSPTKVIFYPVANPSTGSIKARLNLSIPKNLRPGQWVKVEFVVGRESVILIPINASFTRSQINHVYVKTDHGLQLRKIRLGKPYQDNLVVTAGLNNGDIIVTNPTAIMLNGGTHE